MILVMNGQVCEVKGGPGSGHFGHEGRPGEVGGSGPGEGGGDGGKQIGSISDNEREIQEGARVLLEKSKTEAYRNGFGLEYAVMTGYLTQEEANKTVGLQPYQEGYDRRFRDANLQGYLGTDKNNRPLFFFEAALAGEKGASFKSAAEMIQRQSQDTFKEKYGDSANFARAGGRVSGLIGVSERAHMASHASFIMSGGRSEVTSILVNVSDVLFSHRVLLTPFPEREWVVRIKESKFFESHIYHAAVKAALGPAESPVRMDQITIVRGGKAEKILGAKT